MSSVVAQFNLDISQSWISLMIKGAPKLSAGVTIGQSLDATCSASATIPVPTGAPGLVFEVTPSVDFSVDASAKTAVTYKTTPRFVVGFNTFKGTTNYVKAVNAQQGGVEVEDEPTLAAALGFSFKVAATVAGRVGVFGTAGPALKAEAGPSDGQFCAKAFPEIGFGIGATFDVFVKEWEAELGTFTWTFNPFWSSCRSTPPPAPPTPTSTPPRPPPLPRPPRQHRRRPAQCRHEDPCQSVTGSHAESTHRAMPGAGESTVSGNLAMARL